MRTFYIAVEFCHRYDLSPSHIVTELTCHRFDMSPIWSVTDLTCIRIIHVPQYNTITLNNSNTIY